MNDSHNFHQELSQKMDELIERVTIQNGRVAKLEQRADQAEKMAIDLAARQEQTDKLIYGDPLIDNPGLVGLSRDMRRLFRALAFIGGPATLYILYDFLARVSEAL